MGGTIMSRWKERWNDLLPYEKVFHAISSVLLCGYLIVGIFVFLDYEVFWVGWWLFTLGYICTSVTNWRERRGFAYWNIAIAVISAVLATLETIQVFG